MNHFLYTNQKLLLKTSCIIPPLKKLPVLILLLAVFSNPLSIKAKQVVVGNISKSSHHGEQIPITVTVRSIKDLRVKEGQSVRIGQLLALRPIEPQAAARYIPKNHEREVQKQKAKLEKVKIIVKEEGLPEIMIKHEEAKLKDLEFEASEYRKGAVDPKTPQETTYNSPVNGLIKRITSVGGSDGRLNIEILIEQN